MREGTQYEGFIKNADGSVICGQCNEGRHSECPDTPEGCMPLDGYNCECGCEYIDDGPALDRRALDDIAEMLRDPEWGVGMLEDIAELITSTGRKTENYPDNRPTWARH